MVALYLVIYMVLGYVAIRFLGSAFKFVWKNVVQVFGVLVGILGVGVIGISLAAVVVLLVLA